MSTIAETPGSARLACRRQQMLSALDLSLLALFFQIYLYDHSFLQLGLRLVTHLPFSAFVDRPPDRPALNARPISFVSFPAILLNAVFMVSHLARPTPDTRSPAALVDFVGIPHRASALHMLLMDLVAFALQLLFIVLVFEYAEQRLSRSDEHSSSAASEASQTGEPQQLAEEEEADSTTLFDAEDAASDFSSTLFPLQDDHYNFEQPIFQLHLKPTYEQLTRRPTIRRTAEVDDSTNTSVDDMLTALGRRYREERARRGQPLGRAEDLEDEERGLGLPTDSPRRASRPSEPG